MAIEYQLTLAGDVPIERVANLAAPEATEQPTEPGRPRLFRADLDERHGYAVAVYSGSNGYYDAEDDDGSQWEWEPDQYVNLSFRMRKNQPSEAGVRNMVTAVARVLASQSEDAALMLDGNWLLLTRAGGILRKHRPSWWEHYDVADMRTEQA
ncbi:SitI3 family protein [Micromonospora sp. DSM 115977]|uniref:SitI3 family protein n=1 Tax=Micromonospora reichwaldensis TaxID=3075516 RepID=A0ABU2X2B6_9ACTN|nr:SitI3 family protein [Micromonospora sp. DSM 115977]MDT0532335.1 SitI3 family protein [Micromonospora sp. DSM 115977]